MAPPSKLNDIVSKKICDAVRAGSYEVVAALSAGITESTLYAWKRRAVWEPNGAHADFCRALAMAHADAEVALVATIRMAAKGEWRAACWLLTHRYKERWNEEAQTEAPAIDLKEITSYDWSKLPVSERRVLAKLLEGAQVDGKAEPSTKSG